MIDSKWILKNPLSLQSLLKIKTIKKEELLEMVDNTIGSEKHEEMTKKQSYR